MDLTDGQICESLTEKAEEVAQHMDSLVFSAFPNVEDRFGKQGVERTRGDVRFHIQYLRSALCMGKKELFLDYVRWVKVFFTSIKLPEEYILPPFRMLKESLETVLEPPLGAAAGEYVKYAIDRFGQLPSSEESYLTTDGDALQVLAYQYLQSLLRRDRQGADKLIMESVEQGTPVKDIYLHVFQPVQWELGRLWQQNQITVAMEHYVTATTQFMMSRLYQRIFSTEKSGRSMVAASVSGELHELGIRMVSDFFEMEGWTTHYLGANMPQSDLVKMISEIRPEVLALSATISFHLPRVENLISALREQDLDGRLKIIVGGYPFNTNPDLWKKVGADGFAPTAEAALNEVRRLFHKNSA